MFTSRLVSDVLRRLLCVPCAGRRCTGLGSCAKASTWAKTGTQTWTGRPGMWCMTATWLIVPVTGRTFRVYV